MSQFSLPFLPVLELNALDDPSRRSASLDEWRGAPHGVGARTLRGRDDIV